MLWEIWCKSDDINIDVQTSSRLKQVAWLPEALATFGLRMTPETVQFTYDLGRRIQLPECLTLPECRVFDVGCHLLPPNPVSSHLDQLSCCYILLYVFQDAIQELFPLTASRSSSLYHSRQAQMFNLFSSDYMSEKLHLSLPYCSQQCSPLAHPLQNFLICHPISPGNSQHSSIEP